MIRSLTVATLPRTGRLSRRRRNFRFMPVQAMPVGTTPSPGTIDESALIDPLKRPIFIASVIAVLPYGHGDCIDFLGAELDENASGARKGDRVSPGLGDYGARRHFTPRSQPQSSRIIGSRRLRARDIPG